jgi:serine/threonine protein kinase
MDQGPKIVDNYKLEKRIGSGAFGDIYLAKHTTTGQSYAVKIESTHTKHPQLKYEEKIYSYLKGGKGIPNVYFYGEVGDFY